jgi:hypothetical protein
MAAQFAKRPSCWQRMHEARLAFPVRAEAKSTGTPTVKHGRYSNLYSIRGAMPRGANLEAGHTPKPATFKRWGIRG